jgi:hypothetical protein
LRRIRSIADLLNQLFFEAPMQLPPDDALDLILPSVSAARLSDRIAALLPPEAPGLPASAVHRALDLFSPAHIRNQLRALVAQGRARSKLIEGPGTLVTRLYWRTEVGQ